MQDGEQVSGKFLLRGLFDVIENHESSAVTFDKPKYEFVAESTEPVFVGNHNLLDISTDCGFQYGSKTFPFEIEARADVFDDFVFWVLGPHEIDLSFKIITLLWARHTAIADSSSLPVGTEEGVNVVEALTRWCPYVSNFPIVCPGSKRVWVNSNDLRSLPARL